MVEEILPNLYRIEIPLPKTPLRALNSYLIKGKQRNLLVDTGLNMEECRSAMDEGLRELGVSMEDTDIFLTHMHTDHAGLVTAIATPTTTVYCSKPDGDRLKSKVRWEEMINLARRNGFPEQELDGVQVKHPGRLYAGQLTEFHALAEGDTLSTGGYQFSCVETPGHTAGHLCLYDRDKRVLISGDHVLGRITPNISGWAYRLDPLRRYLQSLDKIYKLAVDIALPGHRALITNFQERILELKQHHQERAEEILSILKHGPLDAYQVASKMHWALRYDSWDQFPVPQKWFAAGESLSHLMYLEGDKLVRGEVVDDRVVFSR